MSAEDLFPPQDWRTEIDIHREALPRPVFFRTYLLKDGSEAHRHHHPFDQFHYARQGALLLGVDNTTYIIPALYGMWIPANTEHTVRAIGDTVLEGLDVYTSELSQPLAGCRVSLVSEFARSFIHYATEHVSELYDTEGKEGRMVKVLLDVLSDLPDVTFTLTWPITPSLLAMCREIRDTPDKPHLMEYWAERAGMSPRTFSRHFLKETGLNFGPWKQRMRLLQSVMMLRSTKSITEIALELGYSSTSAFTYAFRQLFGVSPTQYESDAPTTR